MRHSTGKPTKAEAARMAALKDLPCVACTKTGRTIASEVHHLLSGNKRRGHMFTVPLCNWHHRGDFGRLSPSVVEGLLGPSLALSSKRFHAIFGDDESLLKLTNELLEGKRT